jgi:hypothetical protein
LYFEGNLLNQRTFFYKKEESFTAFARPCRSYHKQTIKFMKMPQRLRNLAHYGFLVIMTFTIAVSCDTLESDSVENQPEVELKQSPIIVSPQTSGLIDLNSLLLSSTSNHTFSVTAQPKLGTLESINDFLLKYTPNEGITEGHDSFVLSVFGNNNVIVEKDTIIIIIAPDSSAYPCGVYAFDDFVNDLFPDSIAIVDVLANDTACVMDVSLLQVTLLEGDTSVTAMHGTAEVLSDGKIKYTPGPTFGAFDRFFYKITKPAGVPDGSDEETSVAIVYISGGNVACSALPVAASDTLFIPDSPIQTDSTSLDSLHTPFVILNWDLASNDFYCPQDSVLIEIIEPSTGFAEVNSDGRTVTYQTTEQVYIQGWDQFKYRICAGGGCDVSYVSIVVQR